jgi:hypothetical protein
VAGPATALIVVSAISGVLLVLAVAFDVWLLLSGAAGAWQRDPGMPKETQVAVRAVWGFLMLVTNVLILAGAVQMRGLRSRTFAAAACYLALVPCFGPCFVLGIPFGIWGLVAMNDPRVRRSFGG